MHKILVVDDEEMIRFAFEQFLVDERYIPLLARDYEEALTLFQTHKPDVVFLDYRLPGQDGLLVLEEMKRLEKSAAVIFMTAYGAMDVAIKAMQLGAYEYVTKPLDLDKIRTILRRIEDARKCLAEFGGGNTATSERVTFDRMVGQGPAMQEVFKMIGLLTHQDVTVLITGESGVGKELVAKAIHDNSPRQKKPFVAINCGAMPENLLEAEMFGHEKGAFTGADQRKPGKFEVAAGGTIFLDEIGELQPSLQVKLLRVLQERCFERIGGNTLIPADARVMAATNKDLHEAVHQGHFRKDLFYRLHIVQIHLPPLRERREDIPLLIEHFIRKGNHELGKNIRGLTPQAMAQLCEYPWPGNVRELEHAIKRAMVISREDVLSEFVFELHTGGAEKKGDSIEDQLVEAARGYFKQTCDNPREGHSAFEETVSAVEKCVIEAALQRVGGNQVHAADLLGISRSTLRKKMKDFKL